MGKLAAEIYVLCDWKWMENSGCCSKCTIYNNNDNRVAKADNVCVLQL